MDRFILQPSEKLNHWVCTDTESGVICIFEDHNLNETQEFKLIQDVQPDANSLAKIAREIGDWLRDNHYDKIF